MSVKFSALESRLEIAMGDETGDVYSSYREDAINNAGRELYPILYRKLLDETLITGNALPNGHFEDWSETTNADHWEVSGVTALEETTIIRGGVKSAKVTRAGDVDGYHYCSNTEWGDLLDLQDKTVSFKCWVLASSASQAYLEIYTKQADGTEQTETSSAHSGGGEYELLEIEDFSLNDDLTDIAFRCKVITTNGSAYFDNARVTGKDLYRLLLPLDVQNGELAQVYLQVSGHSDDMCDDLNLGGSYYTPVFGWKTLDDGDYTYLQFPTPPPSKRKIKLVGYCPLEDDLSSDNDTMTIGDKYVPLLIAYAAYLCHEYRRGIVASDQTELYDRECARWLAKTEMLKKRLRMSQPAGQISWGI